MKKIIIIGSGIGGIATAIRLAKNGHDVEVFEKNAHAGGKINEIKKDGFRFDTGPSLFTLPELVNELFSLCNEKPSEWFSYEQLQWICQYYYEDGNKIRVNADKNTFAHDFERHMGEPRQNILTFLNKNEKLYKLTAPVFLFTAFHKLKNLKKKAFYKVLFKLHTLDAFKTMSQRNKSNFKTKYAQQLFNRYATYNGSNPYKTPATLNMIAHLEHNLGAFFPKKGMYNIVQSLVELAKKQGVKFHFNEAVNKVIYDNTRVSGIETAKGEKKADIIISNSDATAFYKHLMPEVTKPKSVTKHELSSSGLIFYWGINKTFPELDLHNILFSNNYLKEFNKIFNEHTVYDDPTVYLFISSKQVADDAPKGKENWFVMINTPADYGQNWNEIISTTRKNIIAKINHMLKTDIEKYIIMEEINSPQSIEAKTSSWKGALYGNSSNGRFAAFSRHPNFSRKFKNLYFTGGSVHPGGGIPLCLSSAKIVSELISEDYG